MAQKTEKARERLFIECPVDLARKLKAALALEGKSLSAWFQEQAKAKVKR